MTIHINMDYACLACDAEFIPYPGEALCPHCEEPADEWFSELVDECQDSIIFNLKMFSRFTPGAWIPLSVADRVVYDVACALDAWLQTWLSLSNSDMGARVKSIPEYVIIGEARERMLQENVDTFHTWFQTTYQQELHRDSFQTDDWWIEYIGKLALIIYGHIHVQHLELELVAAARLYQDGQMFSHAHQLFRDTALFICPDMFEAYEGIIDSALDQWRQSRNAHERDANEKVQAWLLKSASRDYESAAYRIPNDPRMKRLWADAAFLAVGSGEYERAAFLYEKAIEQYDTSTAELDPSDYGKVYKLAVSEDLRREVRGMGGKHKRRHEMGEATYIDLHCGLAEAYNHLGEYDNAIDHLRAAADSVYSRREEVALGQMRLPFGFGMYGSDQREILRWAEGVRMKKNHRGKSWWAKLLGR